jgi:signal transduction histidine kinase
MDSLSKTSCTLMCRTPKGPRLRMESMKNLWGKEFIDLKDSDGWFFIKEMVDTANAKGSRCIEYKWYQPVSKQSRPKIAYSEKFDELIFCSAVY